MSRLLVTVVFSLSGWLASDAGAAEGCAPENGDIDGDRRIDLGDAITVLGHLFLGGPATLLPACASPAPGGLPATGQTKCHDANGAEVPCDVASCAGQDGAYALGCPAERRFLDRGDGTVLDHCTGLVWQKEPAAGPFLWCEALALCDGLSLGGRDDWRLPNARELHSLVDYGRSDPALDPVFAPAAMLWSSTPVSGGGGAWFVGFGAGNLGGSVHALATDLGNRAAARAVRSDGAGGGESCAPENGDVNGDGQIDLGDPVTILGHLFLGGPATLLPLCAPPAPTALPQTGQKTCYEADGPPVACALAACPGQDAALAFGCSATGRFVDHGDGTVLDTCTGLEWQQDSGAQNRTWCQALAYCEGLTLAGHDDWRLPNVRELHSIVDHGRAAVPLDPAFTLAGYPVYWTSTPQTGGPPQAPPQAWSVGFAPAGGGGAISPTAMLNNRLTVRAVRTTR